MQQLALAILEPNLERVLAKLDSLGEAQDELSRQLDAAEASLQALDVDPYDCSETIARIGRLRKRLTAIEQSLSKVSTRVDGVKTQLTT